MAQPSLDDLVRAAEPYCGFRLSEAERLLLARFAETGEARFEDEPTVRAPLLRWLVTAKLARPLFEEWGLRLDGVRIEGDLDLRGTVIPGLLRFRRVAFDGDVLMYLARARSLILEACVGALVGVDDAVVDGTLVVGEFEGRASRLASLSLRDTHVTGNVDIRHTRFPAEPELAGTGASIDLVRATVDGSLFIAPGCTVLRGIDGLDLRVGGNVNLVDLVAERPASDGWVTIRLTRAHISGSLFIHAPAGEAEPPDPALPLHGRTQVSGALVLAGVHVGGDVDLTGLSVVRGEEARGEAHEEDAEEWWGVDLLGASVGGSVYLNGASVWDSGVRLSHADVGGNVELDDLLLMRREDADAARAGAIGDGASPRAPGGPALTLAFARVARQLVWRVIGPSPEPVDLSGATVATFRYGSSSWPDRAHLEGFDFKRIDALSYPFRSRWRAAFARRVLGWAPNDPPAGRLKPTLHDYLFVPDQTHLPWVRTSSKRSWEFDRGLYERVAAALARQGQPGEAVRVMIAAVNDGRRARGWLAVLLGVPYRLFAGNGYRPQRALVWAVGLVALGAVVFGRAFEAGQLIPIDPDRVAQPFHAVLYSADTLLPIVDLHQEKSFEAAGPSSGLVRAYLWAQIGLGWVIATALGATAASFVRRTAS